MRLAHSIHMSSLHITRGFEYCDEFNILGIVGDSVLWLLPDPVSSAESRKTQIVSQHGHPAIVRLSLQGSPDPGVLFGDLCGAL